MKIGFFGNANNYPFMLARALREKGHEIVFILSTGTSLDRPENRYKDIGLPYPDWIHDFSPRWRTLFSTPWRNKCISLLRQCDAVIVNQHGPALLPDVDRPSIALLTGSDLEYVRFPQRLRESPTHRRGLKFLRIYLKLLLLPGLLRRQRDGIKSTSFVSYFARGLVPEGDQILDELGIDESRRMFFMMTDLSLVPYGPPPDNRVLRTFCATRLNWKKPIPLSASELDFKGSDIMIRGLGLFFRGTGKRLNVRLVRKGLHVQETMDLIASEGFSDQVTWLDEMSQSEVLREYREADIVFEQFGQSVVGMAGLDAMASGRPVIANGRPEVFAEVIGAPSPICQASTPEEVCAQLVRLAESAIERERIGLRSREYVAKYFSAERAAELCLQRLRSAL